jgi:hypothetical protein
MKEKNMKNIIGVLVGGLGLVAGSGLAAAHPSEVGIQRPIGVGLVAGSAPGLSLKFWTNPTNAVDLGIGFGLGNFACSDHFNPCGKRTSFNTDYLWQSGRGGNPFSLHVGLGARFWFYDYGQGATAFQVAARVPLGLDLFVVRWLELYGEITPSLAIDPSVVFVEGALGARIYL